ncbi:MAG: class I SAM-dependent methyltransferase [Acidimicrobiia bacterium]|nr:MAG: class I SAM-dependent methyltransferase [Acidimicrobiia bacterium]
MIGIYDVIAGCRSCGARDLERVLAFGDMPLSDRLVDPEEDSSVEPRIPLTLVFCPECSLVQIEETVSPDVLFGADYPYFSSYSDTLLDHSKRNVEALIDRYQLSSGDLVVELASNDGYLLQFFAEAGIDVLGIDPAPGPAAVAVENGVPTLVEFFGRNVAERLASEGVEADVIIGNNVLAHVPDQNAFVAAMATLLSPSGSIVMEVPYVRDLIENTEFDTIYHEHHCYFSVRSLEGLFARHGLSLNRVEHHPIHGGSLRFFASAEPDREASVDEYLADEAIAGMDSIGYYQDFAARVDGVKVALTGLIGELRRGGARVAAYGAAAKGAILLNYAGLDGEQLDYVVDRNPHKQGKLMPGVRLPIHDPSKIGEDPPDYLLILPWNFKDEIMEQQADFAAGGGRFIIPIPEPTLV